MAKHEMKNSPENLVDKKLENSEKLADLQEKNQNKALEAAEKAIEKYQKEHPALNEISDNSSVTINKQPIRKILDRIKALTSRKEKDLEINKRAKDVASIDKIEQNYKHLLEKQDKPRVKYDSLSESNKHEIDKVYNVLVKKIKGNNPNSSDCNYIIADLDTARRFDVGWFEDLAKHHGIKVDLEEQHIDHSLEKNSFRKAA